MVRLGCITVLLLVLTPGAADGWAGIVSNGRGDQVLIEHVLGQHTRPLFAATRTSTGAFGPLLPITGAGGSYDVSAVVDDAGGSLLVASGRVYDGYRPIAELPAQVVEQAPGGAFGPTRDFGPSASPNAGWQVVGNGRGDVIAFSTDRHYRFRAAGGEFGPVTALPDGEMIGAAMDPDGSVVYVFDNDAHVSESVRPPAGAFGPSTEIAAPYNARPAAARNGRMLVAWADGSQIMGVERPPGGDFGAAFKIADAPEPFADLYHVAVSPGGTAAVSFGYRYAYLATRSASGAAFSKPARIAGEVTPNVAVDDRGDSSAVWFEANREVHAVYARAGDGAARLLLLAPAPAFAPATQDAPGLVIDDAGRASAAWEESDGVTVRTLARDFSFASASQTTQVGAVSSFVSEAPPAACSPPGAQMIARGPRATVFEPSDSIVVRGCLLERGTPEPLSYELEQSTQTTGISFAGPLISYADDYIGHSSYFTTFYVTDLRDPYSGLNRSFAIDSREDYAMLAASRLKPNGAAAWIDCVETGKVGVTEKTCARPSAVLKHLFVWDAHAVKPRLVGSSTRIDPRTFKLHGSLLTWRNGRTLHRVLLRQTRSSS